MSKTKERKIPNLGSNSPAKTVISIIEALLFIAAGAFISMVVPSKPLSSSSVRTNGRMAA